MSWVLGILLVAFVCTVAWSIYSGDAARYGKPCGQCEHATRYATTLRCTRDAPLNETGYISTASVAGAPLCESERAHGRLTAWACWTCGRHGKYWRERTQPEISEHGPTTYFLAVHEDFKGRRDVKVFMTAAERDAFVERITGDDLIYSKQDVISKSRVP